MKKRIIFTGIFTVMCVGYSLLGSELDGKDVDTQPLRLKNTQDSKRKYKQKEPKKTEEGVRDDQQNNQNNQDDQNKSSIQEINREFFGRDMDGSFPKYYSQDDSPQLVNFDYFKKESLFKKYRDIFKHNWEPKETTLNDVQDLTLGTGGTLMPYLRWSHLDILEDVIRKSKAKQSEVNYQNNLSLLRKIANDLIIVPLDTNDFDIVKKTLNICRKNKIHMWTAPDISKTEIEKKRNNMTEQKNIEINTVQKAFFNCRARLSKEIQRSIRSFAEKIPDHKVPDYIPDIIPQEQIDSLKTLYILTILAHNIHKQEYKKFSEIETEFAQVSYTDVLRLVSPESEELVEQTLANFRKMQQESKSNKESKEKLLKTVGSKTNLDRSIIITGHQTL